MTPGHGHEKGKRRRKTRLPEKLPEAAAGAHEKPKKKLGYEMEILAVVIGVVIIAIVFLLFTDMPQISNESQESGEDLVVDTSCVAVNPGMTEQECYDYELKDKAIYENLPEICDEIKTESIRENCKKFF